MGVRKNIGIALRIDDPGANVDTGKVSQAISSGNAINRLQSQEEARRIGAIDRLLIRKAKAQPGRSGVGLVFFPFSRAESYKVKVRIGEDVQEFLFRLRSY